MKTLPPYAGIVSGTDVVRGGLTVGAANGTAASHRIREAAAGNRSGDVPAIGAGMGGQVRARAAWMARCRARGAALRAHRRTARACTWPVGHSRPAARVGVRRNPGGTDAPRLGLARCTARHGRRSREAIAGYLQLTHPLCDQPSVRLLRLDHVRRRGHARPVGGRGSTRDHGRRRGRGLGGTCSPVDRGRQAESPVRARALT